MNKLLAEKKRPRLDGLFGNQDLRNGSAVLDHHTGTLYLRPAKDTLWPRLEGKWTGVAWEQDGKRGRYAPGASAVEFKDGRVRFTTAAKTAEWGCHLRDEGEHYRVGRFGSDKDVLADDFRYPSGGLLKVSGDKITLLVESDPAKVRAEATEFKAPAGSGYLLVEYMRAK